MDINSTSVLNDTPEGIQEWLRMWRSYVQEGRGYHASQLQFIEIAKRANKGGPFAANDPGAILVKQAKSYGSLLDWAEQQIQALTTHLAEYQRRGLKSYKRIEAMQVFAQRVKVVFEGFLQASCQEIVSDLGNLDNLVPDLTGASRNESYAEVD